MNKEKAIMPRITRKLERIGLVTALIAGFLIVIVSVANSGQALLRYLFRRPLPEVYDISLCLELVFFIIPVGYVLLRRGHVNVDVLVLRLPLKARQCLLLGTDILGAVVAVLLIVEGARFAYKEFIIGAAEYLTGYPAFPLAIWLPLASIFLLICFISIIYEDIDLIRQGKEVERREELL